MQEKLDYWSKFENIDAILDEIDSDSEEEKEPIDRRREIDNEENESPDYLNDSDMEDDENTHELSDRNITDYDGENNQMAGNEK